MDKDQPMPEPGRATAGPPTPERVTAVLSNDLMRFGYRIGYLAQLFTGPIYRGLSEQHGVGRPEWVVLFCAAHFETLTAQEVGQMTGRAKANISRAVNKLIRMGLLRREPNPDDARSGLIRVTQAGRALFEVTVKPFALREEAMLSVLTPQERVQFDALLTKLTNRSDGWDAPY